MTTNFSMYTSKFCRVKKYNFRGPECGELVVDTDPYLHTHSHAYINVDQWTKIQIMHSFTSVLHKVVNHLATSLRFWMSDPKTEEFLMSWRSQVNDDPGLTVDDLILYPYPTTGCTSNADTSFSWAKWMKLTRMKIAMCTWFAGFSLLWFLLSIACYWKLQH